MQELRAITAEANSLVNEAKEFVKKWDETPTSYAKAIDDAEVILYTLQARFYEDAYKKIKNNPTSEFLTSQLNSFYEQYPVRLNNLEGVLETLLSTARQPSTQEQCNRPGVVCEWHSGNNYMTKSKYTYTDSDGREIVIKYYVSGDIQQYNEYYPHSTQKAIEINYRDPYNEPGCFTGTGVNKVAHKYCLGKMQSDKAWYSDGTLARETRYYLPDSNEGLNVHDKTYDHVQRPDGSNVYQYSSIGQNSDSVAHGHTTYKDGSTKIRITSGSMTCFADGAGSGEGASETCTAAHRVLEY